MMTKDDKSIRLVNLARDWDEIKTRGLIGPGDGSCTACLEMLFSGTEVFRKHAILHDVFGAIYRNFKFGNGYCYGMTGKWPWWWMKSSPLLGHISGLYKMLVNASSGEFDIVLM